MSLEIEARRSRSRRVMRFSSRWEGPQRHQHRQRPGDDSRPTRQKGKPLATPVAAMNARGVRRSFRSCSP